MIDYQKIAEAIDNYVCQGYQWIDTPWVVSEQAKAYTFIGYDEYTKHGYLVGSAEQGFIELILQGKIKPGSYVSAGPCFRFNDQGQPFKHPYFFKIELCKVGSLQYFDLLDHAHQWLGGEVVETTEGHDIEINGIEVGSYGIRNIGPVQLAYGTGLAEPRYTEALSHVR